MMALIMIILLMLGGMIILFLRLFNTNEKLRKLKNTNQKVNSLSIVQKFIEIIGDNTISSSDKIKKINETLIEKYEIKYSTIVIFDGNKFKIEDTNVNSKHWKTFENLHNPESVFFDSIQNATPKYITSEASEKLPYLEVEFERAKSAIFFPFYVDNVFIGYWLIEGNKSHEFDNIDTTILEVIKNNLVSAIRSIRNQRVLESIGVVDKNSGLKTYEYLFGESRKVIDKYPTSIVSLIKIINLKQIEEKISKKTADAVLKGVADFIVNNLADEYYVAQYYNNEIVIVFSGSDINGVYKFFEDIKQNIEKIKIKTVGSLKSDLNGLAVAPKLNIALTTYYKETALESLIITLDNYLEESDASESSITIVGEDGAENQNDLDF